VERKAIVLKGSLAGKTGAVVEVTPAKVFSKVKALIGAPRK
jgi:ribosomal protein L24